MNLTPSQKEVVQYVRSKNKSMERGFVYWMGGVRSGKSYGSCIAMLEHLSKRQDKVYMVLSYTAKQGLTIFASVLESLAEQYGLEAKVSRGMSNPCIRFSNGCEVLFKGADKEGRDKAIQGLTLSGLIADEVPNLHRPTLHQAEARVSDPGGLRIYTSNKTSLYHWSTKYYHNRLKDGSLDGLLIDSHVQDNQHVDKAYREERANEYTGATLTRFMENEFAMDRPNIYRPVMDTTPRDPTVPDITAIYGHATGYELLAGSWDGGVLTIFHAASHGAYADLDQALAPNAVYLVNSSQTLLARRLRTMGKAVRGYADAFLTVHMEVIKAACRAEVLAIHESASGLWEAIHCYHAPGQYDYPIVKAFEALSHPLRSHVS